MSLISDMLVQIKNAQSAQHERVAVRFSNIIFNIGRVLKDKGFINDVEKKKQKSAHKKIDIDYLDIALKYNDGIGAIRGIKLISKSSRRVYIGKSDIKPIKSGYGISIVSTPKGIMTGDEARREGVGGEFICEVW